MTGKALEPFNESDLVDLSAKRLIAISFGKSPSGSYDSAVTFAKSAELYLESETSPRKKQHLCVFGRSRSQASKAVALLRLINGWKSVLIFVGGRLVTWSELHDFYETLNCYVLSTAIEDPIRHCHSFRRFMTIEDYRDPDRALAGTYIGCCRRISERLRVAPMTKKRDVTHSLELLAVQNSCDWCPNFNPKVWVEIEPTDEQII